MINPAFALAAFAVAQVATPQAAAPAPGNHSSARAVQSEPITSVVQQPLALTCAGGGAATKRSGGFINGNGWSASVISHHDREFAEQVDVRLFSGDDRIRMPRTMLPGIHGGQDGWFKLKNVVANERSIHASAAVSVINNPKVYIDRVTGTISISGKSGDYSGECQIIDANAPAKF